ncbi:hypothetical protein AMS68_005548 [Peltaster fructicola]|uniref:L-serine ammonia-lyase n=1 Tax=Peltaster fructicola TaxID=286661 RepID=A0A6H0XZD5_9PEZI|nr:hypothetical protein AMS68_005548 [Peltaster fructicola]
MNLPQARQSPAKWSSMPRIKAAGASEVIQQGESWKFADAYLRDTVMKQAQARGEEAIYVSPFDHPDVWRGHETLVEEVKAQFEQQGESGAPDVMVCSSGGAGLFIGIAQGMEKVGWQSTTILVMGTHGANSFSAAVESGEHVTIPGITSQATSLGAIRIADRAFELGMQGKASGRVRTHLLSDAEAAMGCWRFADDERMLVELACGVNLALCYDGRLEAALGRPVKPSDRVVIEVCGGSNISTSMLEGWRQEYGLLGAQTNGVLPSSKAV